MFIYAYSFFYYWFRSEMDGFLQGAFFFGYMVRLICFLCLVLDGRVAMVVNSIGNAALLQAAVCYAFFIMLGAVGFVSSLTFVK